MTPKCECCGHHVDLHRDGPCRFYYIDQDGNRTTCGCDYWKNDYTSSFDDLPNPEDIEFTI